MGFQVTQRPGTAVNEAACLIAFSTDDIAPGSILFQLLSHIVLVLNAVRSADRLLCKWSRVKNK